MTSEKSTSVATTPSVERVLDARGAVCPLPIVRLAAAIREIPVGAHLRLLATDPGSDADVRAWARGSGHDLIEARRVDGELHFVLRRTHQGASIEARAHGYRPSPVIIASEHDGARYFRMARTAVGRGPYWTGVYLVHCLRLGAVAS